MGALELKDRFSRELAERKSERAKDRAYERRELQRAARAETPHPFEEFGLSAASAAVLVEREPQVLTDLDRMALGEDPGRYDLEGRTF